MSEHKYFLTQSGELYHANWKYIRREKKNGKWVYTYPEDEKNNSNKKAVEETTTKAANKKVSFADKLKNLFTKSTEAVKNTAKSINNKVEATIEKGKTAVANLFSKKTVAKTSEEANKTIQKGLSYINKNLPEVMEKTEKLVTDNKYVVTRSNREEKIAEIEKTKEWQDIVKRADPEYVTKDKEGNVKYLIDDYIVKKKHPELDLLDDIANGRNLTLNEVNVETFVAAAADYVRTGAVVLGVVSKALMTKFKFSQGAYQEQEKELERLVTEGSNYVVETLSVADTAKKNAKEIIESSNKDELLDAAKNVVERIDKDELASALENLSEEDLRKLLESMQK